MLDFYMIPLKIFGFAFELVFFFSLRLLKGRTIFSSYCSTAKVEQKLLDTCSNISKLWPLPLGCCHIYIEWNFRWHEIERLAWSTHTHTLGIVCQFNVSVSQLFHLFYLHNPTFIYLLSKAIWKSNIYARETALFQMLAFNSLWHYWFER